MRICSIQDCNKPHEAKSYCKMHYDRLKRHGDLNFIHYAESHGLENTPEYRAWSNMKNRCNNPNYSLYHRYGARGIKVCNEWEHSFVTFLKDMGKKPSKEFSIERINNDKGYSKDNCKWATKTEQVLNRCVTLKVTVNGITKPLYTFCQENNQKYKTVFCRIKYLGWSVEKALGITNA